MAGGIGTVAILTGILADAIREAKIHDRDETPELDDDIEHVIQILEAEMDKLRAKVSHPEVVAALRKVHKEITQGGGAVSQRRRRRSRDVALVAVPVLALAFTACGGDDDTAYCVDQNDQIVENQYCDDDATDGGGERRSSGSTAAAWSAATATPPGSRLKGGEKVAASNIAENARRGGFGSGSKTSASGVGRAAASHSGGG